MQVPKNVQFTRLLKVNGQQREFNFLKRNAEQYDLDTSDERGERYMFKLIKHDNEWQVNSDKSLPWLIDLTKDFNSLLNGPDLS